MHDSIISGLVDRSAAGPSSSKRAGAPVGTSAPWETSRNGSLPQARSTPRKSRRNKRFATRSSAFQHASLSACQLFEELRKLR